MSGHFIYYRAFKVYDSVIKRRNVTLPRFNYFNTISLLINLSCYQYITYSYFYCSISLFHHPKDLLQNLILQTSSGKMSKSTVFITGATGFIGAQVTASALRAGYNVKLSVRREQQIDGLRRAFSSYPSALDFCVVPDYTTPEAFGTALQGVDYVIHVASPLPNGNEDLLTPAVKGTTSILEAALKVKEIKKVVVTASVASLVPLDKYVDGTVVTGKFVLLTYTNSLLITLQKISQHKNSSSINPSYHL
jgi:hypothetical protein